MNAKDLLYLYLDYHINWVRTNLTDEMPARIRKQQLESLLCAFGIYKEVLPPPSILDSLFKKKPKTLSVTTLIRNHVNIKYFSTGDFLNDRPYEDNQELITQANDKVRELYEGISEHRLKRPFRIHSLFMSLFNFRQDLYKVAYPTRGMMEGFLVEVAYSNFLQSEIKHTIDNNVDNIDNTLCLLIDPRRREFTIEELQHTYNYPDVDLDKIDLEWRIECY